MAGARGRLIIICGLPGSGKTTLARFLAPQLGATRFSPDDWLQTLSVGLHEEQVRRGVEDLQWEMTKALLALGGAAIIEWGTWWRGERDKLRLEARALGAIVELIYLQAPIDVLVERLRLRGRENPPHTREMLEAWATEFQPPTAEELALYDQFVPIPHRAL